MILHLVRHGRVMVERGRPAATWSLDPSGFDDVWALRDQLPQHAAWFTSPEPRAVETAQLLTDAPVGIIDALREQERGSGWVDDLPDAVRRAFAHPDEPAAPGWEPVAACRRRVVAAVRPVLAAHPADDVVLVGHGTAWTALVAELSGAEPDLERLLRLASPDVLRVEVA